MISKQTAVDIWTAYSEIEKGEGLLAVLEEQAGRREEPNLRDSFGRRRSLQLGVPSGGDGHRLLDVHPSLAIQVIKAHVAQKRAALGVLNERARAELDAETSPTAEPKEAP